MSEEQEEPAPKASWLTIRDRPGLPGRMGFGLAGIGVILAAWFLLTLGEPESRIVDPLTLPSISETASSFHSLWFDRALARSVLASLSRVLSGFFLAAAIAVPLGVVAACYPRLDAFMKPLTTFGRNIPVAALIPLTLIWFGIGDTQKVMFIFFASAAFIVFDTARSVDAVSDRYLDTAYTLGARGDAKRGALRSLVAGLVYALLLGGAFLWISHAEGGVAVADAFSQPRLYAAALIGGVLGFLLWFPIQAHQAIHKVLLPLALPQIVNSLRLLFGLAFGYIMLAEVINAKLGLGNIIIVSQRRGPREHIYLCLIVIALLAFTIDRVALWAQRRMFPYVDNG